ncbi:MAG: alpha/beta hydrolase [Pseudomonadota bacterium]
MAFPSLSLESFDDFALAAGRVGNGPPLALVAGLGGRAVFWDKQIASLSAHFQLILHDHRGTGGSTKDPGPYSIAQMAGDFLSLMDRYEIEQTHFVGHSTGGAIGQYLAVHHPERIGKLVISASWSRPSDYFTKLFALRLAKMEKLDPAIYTKDGSLRGFPASYVMEHLELLEGAGPAQVPDMGIQRARIEAILAHDLKEQLGQITADTLVICAEDDAITPRPYSDEIAAAIPGAKQIILPLGGHFAPQSVPGAYTSAISQFLRGESV